MTINSRQKGAGFERKIATELLDLTGISFKRNLDQYQERGLGDLTPSDDAWPFALELKAYAKGAAIRPAWIKQAFEAAEGVNKHPCVIYKFNNKPIRCAVWWPAMAEATSGPCNDQVKDIMLELSLPAFASLAAEIMAVRNAD